MIECIFTQNRCMTTKKEIINPIGIVIHSSGTNNPNLSRYVYPSDNDKDYDYIRSVIGINKYGNHHNQTSSSKSMHYYIGKTSSGFVDIVKTLPHNVACWGCGKGSKGSYNYSPNAHLQIEVCEDDLSSFEYFAQCYAKIVELCANICIDENLSTSSIVSHKEAHKKGYASNHRDIDHWLEKYDKNMDILRKDVANYIDNLTVKPFAFNGVVKIDGTEYEVSGTARKC